MKSHYIFAAVLGLSLFAQASPAQNAPLPGGGVSNQSYGQASAPVPGAQPRRVAQPSAGGGYGYSDLPLNADDAKARIVELTNLMPTARPQELQERVEQLSGWLSDMVDAHNKMANSFGRHENLKAQSNAERQSAQRFLRLKNQAQLLKADLLIAMRRFPEALTPLVEIVSAEPTTETGKNAYKRLQDLGFSPEIADNPDADIPAVLPVAAAKPSIAAASKKAPSAAKKPAPAPAKIHR